MVICLGITLMYRQLSAVIIVNDSVISLKCFLCNLLRVHQYIWSLTVYCFFVHISVCAGSQTGLTLSQ